MMRVALGPAALRLTVEVGDERLARRLAGWFQAAGGVETTEGGRALVVRPRRTGAAAAARWEGETYRAGGPGGEGWFDTAAGKGELALCARAGSFLETFLRQLFIHRSYRLGGIVLHAVAFGRGSDAVVASGPSESGKSTLAQLVEGEFTVYSDELNVVTAAGEVWALPFRGSGVARVNYGGGRARLLAFHRRGAAFRARPLASEEAAVRIWRNVVLPEEAAEDVRAAAFARGAALAEATPAYEVDVPMTRGAAGAGFAALLK